MGPSGIGELTGRVTGVTGLEKGLEVSFLEALLATGNSPVKLLTSAELAEEKKRG